MKISIDATAFQGLLGTVLAELRTRNCSPVLLRILETVDSSGCNLQKAASTLYPFDSPEKAKEQILSDAKTAIEGLEDEDLKKQVTPIAVLMQSLDPAEGPKSAIKGLQGVVNQTPMPFALKAGINTVLGGVKYE